MDPLTALSLAANVIAVVDFCARLIHTTWQISKSGAKSEYVELEEQTIQVQGLLGRLKPGLNATTTSISQDDKDLIMLCGQAEHVSNQLLKMLDTCKTKEGAGRVSIENFWRAVKSEWREDDIKSLQDRLESIDAKAHRLLTLRYYDGIFSQLSIIQGELHLMGINRAREFKDIRDAMWELSNRETDHDDVSRALMLKVMETGGMGKAFAVQAGILAQLRFEEIDRRLNDLNQRPSHEKSYLWLGGSSPAMKNQTQGSTSFDAWLTSSEKLYWISGLPGSGKSTLMKFLFSSPQTTAKLANWKQGKELLVAAYFFWEVGKIPLLKTQEGLLRALLFQILRQCTELIEGVYFELWMLFDDATPGAQDSLSNFAGSRVSLHVHDLLGRLQRACSIISARGYGMFLVIDGLDEYDGNSNDIIKLISAVTAMPNVKVCVSSRPENVFLDAFGNMSSKLYMEEVNKPDIMAYVRDRLENHQRFKEAAERVTLGADLIARVVDKSRGVFLWVSLVVPELEEGLSNCDTIIQLEKRLDALPRDLQQFFGHMLDRVDERYWENTAAALLITYQAYDLLSPLAYWFVSEGPMELDGVHEVKPAESRLNHRRREFIDRRLRSYGRGLLVTGDQSTPNKYAYLPSSSLFDEKVNFLHRTVQEFMEQPDVAERLDRWKSHDFDADQLICKAVRAQIRSSPTEKAYFAEDGPIAGLTNIFHVHSERLLGRDESTAVELRRSLAEILTAQCKSNGHSLTLPQFVYTGTSTSVHSSQEALAVPRGSTRRSPSPRSRAVAKVKSFLKGV